MTDTVDQSEKDLSETPRLLAPGARWLADKLASLSGVSADLWRRFRKRLENDAGFREQNFFILALLPDTPLEVLREIAVAIESKSEDLATRRDDGVEHHTWCVAPHAMRMAAYATWLHGTPAWDARRHDRVGQWLMDFCEAHAINVLRSRIPTSDNQSMSLALTCAVVGMAFAGEARADRLRIEGLKRLGQVLDLTPEDGYTGEGPTYQSHVVTPLAMWTAALFEMLEGVESLSRVRQPGGATLLNLLRVETLLPSPGLLLPGMDHHGWQRQINLAGIAYWAQANGQPQVLHAADRIWDETSTIAWGDDDRMWALLYWPEQAIETASPQGLCGWALPHTAAALDDADRRLRLLLCYDSCAHSLQGVGRGQTNPNHVLFEMDGSPIFADGKIVPNGDLQFQPSEFGDWLPEVARKMLVRQFGGVAPWRVRVQEGLLGAANAIVIDEEETYFSPQAVCGRLVYEERTAERHLVSADARAFYTPRYDLTRATRAVATTRGGPCWIVDELQADSPHACTWQVYLRKGCTLEDGCLSLRTGDGQLLTLAWLPVDDTRLATIEDFPAAGDKAALCWPENGSQRLRLRHSSSRSARFVVCLLPNLHTRATITVVDETSWRVAWEGGGHILTLPAEALASRDPDPMPPSTWCDLAEPPYPSPATVAGREVALLRDPPVDNWRTTCEAIQGLKAEDEAVGLPLIHRLLMDVGQRYQVHAVAAWRLGRCAYRPAREDLKLCRAAAEPNLAARAAWAVERIKANTG